jgi:glycosyltransferase involved in cell wall biosynthesis
MNGSTEISVIVSTLDRASSLDRCLAHLATSASQFDAPWELIVVDNGSTDATPSVVARWTLDLPMRSLREHRRGLAVARNAGLRAATGRITAFVDDDCIVTPEWLPAIIAAYATPGSADGIGGRVSLWDSSDLPVSIRDFADPRDVTDLQGIMSRLIGCNFTARTDALRSVGGFDERLGAGTSAMSAEDFDLCYRMLRKGLRLSYEPALRLFHAHGRKSREQLTGLMRGYLVGRGAWYAKHATRADWCVIRNAYWEIRGLLSAMLRQSPAPASPLPSVLSHQKMLAALAHGAFSRIRGA